MPWKFSFAFLCLFALFRPTHAQEVIIAHEEKPHLPKAEVVAPLQSTTETEETVTVQPVKTQAPAKKTTTTVFAAQQLKPAIDAPRPKTPVVKVAAQKQTTNIPSRSKTGNHILAAVSMERPNNRFETAFTRLADGFDFPVGRPDAQGYYKARGFRSRGHLGEDWDGVGGGDTDLGDPIYSIANGLVVFARDCHMGWGNVMILRHSYREAGVVKTIDSLYAHLDKMLVRRGQAVARGQEIATMGTAHGLYDAHLHLEIRRNIEVGMSRTAFARDFSSYYDPSQFILTHRHVSTSGGSYRVAMNTFVRDATINFDKARNFSHSHSGGGTRESAAALKKAIASKQ
jgi:murein DD-endopeptidase MepM/ murein hydrolase activator NlpD